MSNMIRNKLYICIWYLAYTCILSIIISYHFLGNCISKLKPICSTQENIYKNSRMHFYFFKQVWSFICIWACYKTDFSFSLQIMQTNWNIKLPSLNFDAQQISSSETHGWLLVFPLYCGFLMMNRYAIIK